MLLYNSQQMAMAMDNITVSGVKEGTCIIVNKTIYNYIKVASLTSLTGLTKYSLLRTGDGWVGRVLGKLI